MQEVPCSRWKKDDDARLKVSFEFFPPRTEAMEKRLWEAVTTLAPLGPRFMSVTYGAGGSTRERTHNTVRRILHETNVTPAAHLTCVGASRDEVDAVARDYWAAGVRHLVALRGDPPEGVGQGFQPHPEGYANAAELVAGLKAIADFDISVAAYPEVHPEAVSPEADLDNLRRKVDAGANRLITQYFFDVADFLRFRDRVSDAGITTPLVPGILPVSNFDTVARFSAACGARIPLWLERLFEGLDDDPATRQLVAATVASEQCLALQGEGIDEFHFYTLNRAELVKAICRMLGVCPDRQERVRQAPARPAALQESV
ncbi:methylenetetrahydrofolate reductase [NAD(P)H] [Natronospira bacteriovora]|uniref:Methylenetetrahydrofolate reductase n=1 Tax=Natronospira bacteriovora TaxID=3069753 RepID=A0ABU0W9S7_9GAMM|nr:methylenetetrahydrofolate reductase [NAD(P)H] [Natronospira sp. AB-CW4]MDQ2070513.1 methylenetetrahydrofolate reductase [NAD(P)H] [Natronospira sp. AB-CW4]